VDVLSVAVRHGCILISADMLLLEGESLPGTGTCMVFAVIIGMVRLLSCVHASNVDCSDCFSQTANWRLRQLMR
jgi:hypothetical protein